MTFSENEAPTVKLLNPLSDPPARGNRSALTAKYTARLAEAEAMGAFDRAGRVVAAWKARGR